MTLKELKEKCISKGRKIIKISEKPAIKYLIKMAKVIMYTGHM